MRSWDGRSILLTVAEIISQDEGINRPDMYRLDLPESPIGPQAALHDGPPIGRPKGAAPPAISPPVTQVASFTASKPAMSGPSWEDYTVRIFTPQHVTVDEVLNLLPDRYTQYLTKDLSRNVLLFEGPQSVLDALDKNLALVDTNPPQILVDLYILREGEQTPPWPQVDLENGNRIQGDPND